MTSREASAATAGGLSMALAVGGLFWAILDSSDENLLPCSLALCAVGVVALPALLGKVKWIIAGGVALLLIIFALYLRFGPEGSSSGSPTFPAAQSTTSNAARITIDQPELGTVPRCATIRGSAPEVPGLELWVAHEGTEERFFYAKAIRENGDRWRVKDTVGGQNDRMKKYNVRAFYVDESTSRFLESLRGEANDGGPGYAYTEELPPTHGLVSLIILRDSEPNASPCK